MPKYIAMQESKYEEDKIWEKEDISFPENTPLAALRKVGFDPTKDLALEKDGGWTYRTTLYECTPVEFEVKVTTKPVTTKVTSAKIILKKD